MRAQVVDLQRSEGLVRMLAAALGSRRLYGTGHRRTSDALRAFANQLHGHFEGFVSGDRLAFAVRNGRITHEGIAVGEGGAPGRLAAELERQRCAEIGFTRGVSLDAISTLVEQIACGVSLLSREIPGIDVVGVEDDVAGDLPPHLRPYQLPLRLYENAADVLDRVMRAGAEGGRIDLEDAHDVSRWTAETAFRTGTRLLGPVQLLRRDNYTYQHSLNVFLIATTMLQPLARDVEELTRWARAALLHDVGKCRIPLAILHKQGKLTPAEFLQMQRHTEYGARLLLEHGEKDPLAIEVAYCHHMRDDGLGYPVPTLPFRPGPVSHVVQVADMFEALISHRPYKSARPVREAVQVIRETPGMLTREPALQLLVHRLSDTPPGAEVELTTGERGFVLGAAEAAPGSIDVLITSDREGRPLDRPTRDRVGRDTAARGILSVDLAPLPERS